MLASDERACVFLRQSLVYIANVQIGVYNRQRYVNSRMEHQYLALHSKEEPSGICDVIDDQSDSCVLTVRSKTQSGKIIDEVILLTGLTIQVVTFGNSGIVRFSDALLVSAPNNAGATATPESALEVSMFVLSDIEDLGVSFNLNLTDNQREARSNVQLPYMQAQKQPAVIFYAPDDADDFDEEDPDSDLAI